MKKLLLVFAIVLSMVAYNQSTLAAGGGFGGEDVLKVKCYEFGKTGPGSYNDPANGIDGDIWAIPAGTVISGVEAIVHTALTGTTVVTVGDDDDADGFMDSGDVTEGTPGVYKGDAAYNTSLAFKFYAAAGKEVKLDITGTLTAGKYCVAIHGYRL